MSSRRATSLLQRPLTGMCRVPVGFYRAEGMIKNVNTIEEYKIADKTLLISQAGSTVSNNSSVK